MAKIYATLIKKGLKRLEDVPEKIREEVRAILEAEGFQVDRQEPSA